MIKNVIGVAVLSTILASCAIESDRWVVPSDAPETPRTAPRTVPQPSYVPSLGPEDKADLITKIYIINKSISSNYKLQEVINSWERAKYTQLQVVKECPIDWNTPCVTIRESTTLSLKYAGETNFSTYPKEITIDLNARITQSTREAQTTLCHELGHVLGLPHVVGRRDTCMYDGYYYRKEPMIPTELDLRLVDRLGPWSFEKMYDSSWKTIDLTPVAP